MARYLSLIMLVVLAALPYGGQGRAVLRADEEERAYFRETGQWISGVFLKKWREGGGLPLYGFPLTPAYWEGGYSVQLFERVRMEWHPEWAGSPYEVSLGQLGKEWLVREGLKVPRPGPPPPGARLFSETGYSAGGHFLRAWERYGGLSHFGYPLSPEMRDERSGLLVQYFERARMEHHPEHAGTPHEVLFTLLGSERAAALDPLLRARWTAGAGGAEIAVEPQGRQIQTLDAVTVRTTHTGDLHVLGGDNRRYSTHKVEASKPLTLRAAGVPGPHSFVLMSGGEVIATRPNAFSTSAPSWGIESGDPVWDGLYGRVESYLKGSAVEYNYPHSPRIVRGHRSPDNAALWLRDHVYTMRGSRYFERDTRSALEYFATTQRPDGSLDDFLLHTPATPVFTAQIEIEADREFLFVEGVYAAWQSAGDDEWLRRLLPPMRKALEHTFTDPRRWSAEHGLIKRAFTIDMWDYEQGSDGDNIRRGIDKDTRWSIMHGDNTGAYRSALLLARMERRLGNEAEARGWEDRARDLLRNLNRVSWNGRFFRHQVHLTPVLPTGVDEERQISLSNAYALNRGALTGEQARAIIETYRERGRQNGGRIFAEWYSIDPPFEANFGLPGQYANGGVMPLVGGELARGALNHGHEEYGLDILRRYWALTERWGGSYLWYHPDGRPGIGTAETINTDAWGSSAMLAALTEGLAGVVDDDARFRRVSLSPRWAATTQPSASVALRYPAGDAYFAYRWEQSGGTARLTWGGRETAEVKLHLLLPPNTAPRELLVNGAPLSFTLSRVAGSLYLDATLPGIGHAEIK